MQEDDTPEGGAPEPQNTDQDTSLADQPPGADREQTTSQETGGAQDKTFTQAELDRIIADRIARAEKKYAGFSELQKKAAELDKLKDAQKTEVERLNEQLSAAQIELQEHRVAEIRRTAAADAGLPAKYAKYIMAVDAGEALEQAKELAKDLKPAESRTADLKQGNRGHTAPAETRDQIIRRMAGYGP
jgi:DNA repair exonuclease SbcCD ATPase subunit